MLSSQLPRPEGGRLLTKLNKFLDKNSKQHSNAQKLADDTIDIDIDVGEKIIEKLFVFIKNNLDNDSKIDSIKKSAVLFFLPGIRKGSIEYVRRNQSDIAVLLDDIQKELNRRK